MNQTTSFFTQSTKYMRLFLICTCSFGFLLIGCNKKSELGSRKIVALNVVHAIIGIPALKIDQIDTSANFSSIPILQTYGTGGIYYYEAGICPFGVLASPDSSVLLSAALNLTTRMNSVFLVGDKVTPDTIFHREVNFPFIPTGISTPVVSDSVIHVRFVNLSPNSRPLKVVLAASPSINEITDLKYKDITDFKPYSARSMDPTRYVFQVKDASDDSLLTSVTLNITSTNRFKCVAVIIRGVVGGSSPYELKASIVNYY